MKWYLQLDDASNLDPHLATYETSNNEEQHTEALLQPSIFSDVLKFKKVKKAFKKENENNEEQNKTSDVKNVKAKVDSRRKKWNKEYQDFMLEEWRKKRGFTWNQPQTETNRSTENRYNDVRIFACVRFNKCAVLYTHAS